MSILDIYGGVIPSFLMDAAATPPMLRLKDVGMNCGCEYTSFPRFVGIAPYSRWEHSLGVALIVWRFTRDKGQALAGLLHDVATPTFAHVIDFLRGDHLTQQATEEGTAQIIAGCPELTDILASLNLDVSDVEDYHRYPIADNDTPRLSADRLEYTLGNLVNFGFMDSDTVSVLYGDLCVGEGEDGAVELAFRSPQAARSFAFGALSCSEVYVSDADRCAMQVLADLLRDAVASGVLEVQDFHGTERALLEKLRRQPAWAQRWAEYQRLSSTLRSETLPPEHGWMRVPAKKRCIDPLILGKGRASNAFPEFGTALKAFRERPLDYWIKGIQADG